MPNLIRSVNFGTNRTGLTTIAYTLINTDGTTKQARTTTGVFEVATGTGIYGCLISFDAAWEGIVLWDSGEATKRYALDVQWKSQITDEIADAVFDEDITGHTTANSAGARLNAIFQYVRGGTGGAVITRQVGALTDDDKLKIFKWFESILNKLKLLQESTESITTKIQAHIAKLSETLPKPNEFTNLIVSKVQETANLTSQELTVLKRFVKNLDQTQLLNQIADNIKFSFEDLKKFSLSLSERIKIKEDKWEDIKKTIKETDNTAPVLNTLHLFFKETNLLKEQLLKLAYETTLCSKILIREASTATLENIANEER